MIDDEDYEVIVEVSHEFLTDYFSELNQMLIDLENLCESNSQLLSAVAMLSDKLNELEDIIAPDDFILEDIVDYGESEED